MASDSDAVPRGEDETCKSLVRERADAARNRRHVLAAAERLIAARGVDALTMGDIAVEAGVGRGTLYRRFGDPAAGGWHS